MKQKKKEEYIIFFLLLTLTWFTNKEVKMTKAIYIVFLSIAVFCMTTLAHGSKNYPDSLTQEFYDIGPSVENAIKTANAAKLAQYFNNSVSLQVPGKSGSFGKTQAEFIIKDFFSNYPPSSFSINNQGKSSATTTYYIGTYKSGSKNFRCYYTIIVFDNKERINVLKFE